jgi:hypothetical protein
MVTVTSWRVPERLSSSRPALGRAGDAVKAGRHPDAQDEVVVFEAAAVSELGDPGGRVHAGQLAVPEARPVLVREAAERVGHIAGGQPRGSHLVQQRLERAVDVPVGEGHPQPAPGQPAHRGQAGEPGPDHEDPRPVIG